ncbi:MAG: DNA starvation/stationary phase protection protein Dps [Gemmataceae bacterium]
MKLHPTHNDLPESVRQAVITLLNARLADAIDLGMQCKQAHWNVKGPNFLALHKLVDELFDHVSDHIDELAERIVSLGGTARGTLGVVSQESKLPAYPLDAVEGAAHLEALAKSLSAFGKAVRAAIDASDEAGDAVTADLFTQMASALDKDLWMVEAHLQGK